MKPSVLCINRSAIVTQGIPANNAHGIYPFDLSQVAQNQYHFINRDVVDSNEKEKHLIGCALPQILGYCVIKCGNHVLTYARKRGAEARLHGNRSLGFGGHVDIDDYSKHQAKPYFAALAYSIERELLEEVGLQIPISMGMCDTLIVDQSNPVGSVHVGLPILINVELRNELEIDYSEIADPQWISIQQLKEDIALYENWSQLLIEKF